MKSTFSSTCEIENKIFSIKMKDTEIYICLSLETPEKKNRKNNVKIYFPKTL